MLEKYICKFVPKRCYYYLPKKIAHSLIYYQAHGEKMNWENPTTLDEKLHWLMTFCIGKNEAFFADKHAVRQYVADCGFTDLLVPEYKTWSSVADVDIEGLPKKFVLKTNHASGGDFYVICHDKAKICWDRELKNLNIAMNTNFAKLNMEYHYAYIKPLLMAEELLEDNREDRMTDYKILCFYGIPSCIEVVSNRSKKVMINYYDTDWNRLPYGVEGCTNNKEFEKPRSLPIMLKAASKLSEPFPFARIDFYDVDGKAFFGEITLTPGSGNLIRLNKKGQTVLGNKLKLPVEKKIFVQNKNIIEYVKKNYVNYSKN